MITEHFGLAIGAAVAATVAVGGAVGAAGWLGTDQPGPTVLPDPVGHAGTSMRSGPTAPRIPATHPPMPACRSTWMPEVVGPPGSGAPGDLAEPQPTPPVPMPRVLPGDGVAPYSCLVRGRALAPVRCPGTVRPPLRAELPPRLRLLCEPQRLAR